jgi:hypothetical protein
MVRNERASPPPLPPPQTAYIERSNRSMRRGVLDTCLFANLREVRETLHHWIALLQRGECPHASLGNLQTTANQPKQNNRSGLKTLLLKYPIKKI